MKYWAKDIIEDSNVPCEHAQFKKIKDSAKTGLKILQIQEIMM